MAAGRGRLSSIDLLPPEAEDDVEWAHTELAARACTIDEIHQSFCTRLLAKGIKPISRSAFHRSSMRLNRMASRLGEVREIAGVLPDDFGWRWKAEDVGGFVLAAKRPVQALQLAIGREQHFNCSLHTDSRLSAMEKARQAGFRKRGSETGGGAWKVEADHG